MSLMLLALLSVLLLLSAELANSSLERVVDLVSPGPHPMAGEAKDMAAGGVLLVSFGSASVVLFALMGSLGVEGVWSLGGVFIWILFSRFRRGSPR
jgi:diacylglycerol kinase